MRLGRVTTHDLIKENILLKLRTEPPSFLLYVLYLVQATMCTCSSAIRQLDASEWSKPLDFV